MSPTAERLATLVRFHSGCRADAGCETCEVLALLDSAISALVEARYDMSHGDETPAFEVIHSFLDLVGR